MAGVEAQKQIRDNTREINEFLKDLQDWQKVIKVKDNQLKTQSESETRKIPPVRGKPTAPAAAKAEEDASKSNSAPASAANHTYDYFRDKWDKFDVEAALKEVDEEDRSQDKSSGEAAGVPQLSAAGTPQLFAAAYAKENKQDVLTGTSEGLDATSEKELGNQYFKDKKYVQAIECYSTSLVLRPTAVAYANRAMAFLKIRRYQDAELDCSEAISLDDRYTKAYARRGTARKEQNKLLEAVDDFEFALRLEPQNKELQKQYQEAKEAYEKKNPFRPPDKKVQLKVKQLNESSLQQEESQQIHVNKKPAAEKPVEMEINKNYLQKPAAEKPVEMEIDKKEKVKLAASRAAASVMNSVVQNMSAPKTSYEFETLWRSLADDSTSKVRLIKLMDPVSFPKIFKDSLSSSLMVDFIQTLKSSLPEEANFVLQVLDNISKVGRFNITVMFLTKADKSSLESVFEVLSSSAAMSTEDRNKLEMLRIKYKID